MIKTVIDKFFKPVDIASIVFFRIGVGILIVYQFLSYLFTNIAYEKWIKPVYYFKYYGFHWVEALPENYIYAIVIILIIAGVLIATGFLYRIATVIFFLGFTYLFLLDQTIYENHYYFICLLSFLLIFMPANRAYSIDSSLNPEIRAETISKWCIWIIRFQIIVVFFYAGVAKLNSDWLNGYPLKLHFKENDNLAYLFSYGGLFFEFAIIPLLLYNRTRLLAFILIVAFNLANKIAFHMPFHWTFPYFFIIASTLFFSPSWPRKIFHLNEFNSSNKRSAPISKNKTIKAYLILLFALIQVLVPLRHFIYPSYVAWSDEGHYFSWRMFARDKSGVVYYQIQDIDTGKTWYNSPKMYLTKYQHKDFLTNPRMIVQYAKMLEKKYKRRGFDNLKIKIKSYVSLNGREAKPIIMDNVDLTSVNISLLPAKWITPYEDTR